MYFTFPCAVCACVCVCSPMNFRYKDTCNLHHNKVQNVSNPQLIDEETEAFKGSVNCQNFS